MKPIDIIKTARLATFDDKPDQQTWEDKQYLVALNDARSLVFSKCPESRVTAVVGLTAYSEIAEADLANEMVDDAIYRNFYVEFLAWRFFDSGSRDTANRQKAIDHKTGYMQALSSLTGGR
jgi:hypothetical protein